MIKNGQVDEHDHHTIIKPKQQQSMHSMHAVNSQRMWWTGVVDRGASMHTSSRMTGAMQISTHAQSHQED